MKMLYPRKMEEVLWHSATWRFSKSILVKMPRLPTMRVIGSQFISTSFFDLLGISLVGAVMVPMMIAPSFLVSWSSCLTRLLTQASHEDRSNKILDGTQWSAPRGDAAIWVPCSRCVA